MHIQIILHRISSGQQGQRVLGLLPLLLERHGHRSQFRIRIFQPLAQRLSRSGFGQTRRFLRAQRLFAGRQTLGQLGLQALLGGHVILQTRDQGRKRLTLGGCQPRQFSLCINFAATAGQRHLQRLFTR